MVVPAEVDVDVELAVGGERARCRRSRRSTRFSRVIENVIFSFCSAVDVRRVPVVPRRVAVPLVRWSRAAPSRRSSACRSRGRTRLAARRSRSGSFDMQVLAAGGELLEREVVGELVGALGDREVLERAGLRHAAEAAEVGVRVVVLLVDEVLRDEPRERDLLEADQLLRGGQRARRRLGRERRVEHDGRLALEQVLDGRRAEEVVGLAVVDEDAVLGVVALSSASVQPQRAPRRRRARRAGDGSCAWPPSSNRHARQCCASESQPGCTPSASSVAGVSDRQRAAWGRRRGRPARTGARL